MVFETFVSTCLLCNDQCRHRNFYTAGYTTAVCVVQSKGRQQEPTAPTINSAARLIGCGVRAAAAAAAAVAYTRTTIYEFILPFFLVCNHSVPTALLRARYTGECVVVQYVRKR